MRRGPVTCGEAAPAGPPVPTGCPCHGPCHCCWSRSPQPQMPPGGLRAGMSPPSPAVTGKPPELVRAPAFLTQGPAHSHGWGGRDSPNRAGIRRVVAKILGGQGGCHRPLKAHPATPTWQSPHWALPLPGSPGGPKPPGVLKGGNLRTGVRAPGRESARATCVGNGLHHRCPVPEGSEQGSLGPTPPRLLGLSSPDLLTHHDQK